MDFVSYKIHNLGRRHKMCMCSVLMFFGKDCKLYVKSTRNLRWAILGALKWEKRGEKCNLILQDWEKRDLGASVKSTDYGRPMNPSFIEIPGRQIGQINFGAFGVFSAKLSSPILVLWSVRPLSMFSSNQPLFLQKTKPLYPHTK